MSIDEHSRLDLGGYMSRLSISTRLVLLSSVLLAILVGVSLLLSHGLNNSARALTAEAHYVEELRNASTAQKSFGDLKYWLTDLAVSLLNLSETRARQARQEFEKNLTTLEPYDPAAVATIRSELDSIMSLSLDAVDSYTQDHRVIGNSIMAKARVHIAAVDTQLTALVNRIGDNAARASIKAHQDASQAVHTSWIIIATAGLLALALTGFVLRSIVLPLGRITDSIEALTNGQTDIELPRASHHEIGAIVRTLGLFREGLIERERLAAEREQAMVNLKDARDRARASSRLLQLTFNHMAQGVAMFDGERKLVAWNKQFGHLLGLPDQMMDRKTSYSDLIRFLGERGDLGTADAEREVQTRIAQLDKPYIGERTREDGTVLEVRRNPVPDGGFVTMYTDITRLKRAQNELADLVTRLELARDQANEANRTKSAFLANMSHELRTPLNAIIGYSEILKEEAEDQGIETFLPDLDRIEGAGRHLLGVINDILDISKIEAGKTDIYLEDIDIAGLVEEVESIVRPLVAKNNNRMEVNCPADIGSMHSDMTKLKQSLLNLISNSSKFTTEGKLTLDVLRDTVGARDFIRFAVSDTGIGMSKEQLSKLFQAFSQADASTTREFGGTGLGLAITKHFCELLGGGITVESTPNKGSTFTITLPDLEAVPAGKVAPSRVPVLPDDAPTILVADDDPAMLDLLGFTLGKEGYKVIHAGTGEDVLAQARACRPKAITLDVIMPRMDGWSVLAALKADAELRDIPVIMVTVVKDRGMAMTLGATDFMTKPVDRAALLAILRQHCHSGDDATVLLVDDDKAIRDTTRRALNKLGFKSAEAANGKEALNWLETNPPPALILLDLMMPEMDGFAFIEAAQSRADIRDIPIVVLTSKDLSGQEKQLLSGRTAQVLAKGETSNVELIEAIRRSLGPSGPDERQPVRA